MRRWWSHHRTKKFLFLVLTVSTFYLTGCTKADKKAELPKAVQGVLDLREWDFSKDGIVRLDGEWEFYWQELLSPEDFSSDKMGSPKYISLPAVWRNSKINGKSLPTIGYATFRLTVLTSGTEEFLGISLPEIYTAYVLFKDNSLLLETGKVSKEKKDYQAHLIPKATPFQSKSNNFTLIIQVSNFRDMWGGIRSSISMGPWAQISKEKNKRLALDLLLFGSIIIMGLYHLVLFAFRNKERSSLYFGLVCIFIAIQSLLTGERFFYQIFSFHDFEVLGTVDYLLLYVSAGVFSLYFKELYPNKWNQYIIYPFLGLSGIYSIFALFTPVIVLAPITIFYELLLVALGIYIVIALGIALKCKSEGVLIFLFGFMFLFATVISDILYDNRIINIGYTIYYGLIAFIFSQSFLLSMKFSRAFTKIERFSEELDSKNKSLTQTLDQLQKTQEKLIQQEKRAVVGDLTVGIAHEMKNQLTIIGVLDLILDKLPAEAEEEKQLAKFIFDSRDRMIGIIDEIRGLARNEESDYELRVENLEHVITEAIQLAKMDSEVKSKEISFESRYTGDSVINKNKIIQVLLNLIKNAAQAIANIENGKIMVKTETKEPFVLVEIIDNGVGIEKEKLERIWEPFFSTKGEKGTGVGLDICKRIIEGHKGIISCESELNKGTTFTFSLLISDK